MSASKGIKNAGYGILANILTIAVGIIIPRLVLINLGSEANGLMSSVGNILTYMSLLEAGVGTATVQALYKPIATTDYDSINSIMSATNYFYKRTGKVYLAIVIVISVVYTIAIKTDLPRTSVFIVVLLSGLSGVISYFFQGKFKVYLSAEGKGYVNTNIVTFISISISLTKALLLYNGFGIVSIQISSFILNIIQMIVYIVYIRHHYPWMNTDVNPNFEAINQRNAVLIHQICWMVFSNTDVLLLTIFAGLKEVSVYSMYAMIYGMVKSIAVVLYESYTYALGQSYNTDKSWFMKLFNAYEVFSIMITFALYCICRAVMNPFLTLYTAGVNDIQYVDKYLPSLFAAFYLLHNGRTSSATLINISQHFEDTKWRSVLEACINLSVSIFCVIRFGVYGVLMGTIVALLYRSNDMIVFAASILNRSCWITYRRWLSNIAVFIGISVVLDKLTITVDNYYQLLLYASVTSLFVVVIFCIANIILERECMLDILEVVKRRICSRE